MGNFNVVSEHTEEKFDYVTLIGVFEYAESYMGTCSPYDDFLTKIRGLLKAEGTVIIAIENKLCLLYTSPVLGDETANGSLMKIIADAAEVSEEDILGHDLFLYNRVKGKMCIRDSFYIAHILSIYYTNVIIYIENTVQDKIVHINISVKSWM